jgi:hypothetical protein
MNISGDSMTKKLATSAGDRGQPPTQWNFFGPAPLLDGEDPAAYDELLARVSGAIKLSDILEEIWVRDVVDLVWEALRLRRLKADLITANAHNGLERILKPLSDWQTADALSKAWARRDPKAIRQVGVMLASADLTMDAVMAETLAHELDKVERIDRMIMSAEARRNAVLREVATGTVRVSRRRRSARQPGGFTQLGLDRGWSNVRSLRSVISGVPDGGEPACA